MIGGNSIGGQSLPRNGTRPGSHDRRGETTGRVVVHVGYGRTATTLLQNEIFPDLDGVTYLGKCEADYPRWLIEWSYLDDIEFERVVPALGDYVARHRAAGRTALISSEAFCRTGGVIPDQARRIARVAPEAHVVLVLRDPIQLLLSLYKGAVTAEDLDRPFEDCLDWSRTPMVIYKRRPICLPDFLYDEAIEAYKDAVGECRLTVLKYEDMVATPEQFFACLGRALGVTIAADVWRPKLSLRVNASPTAEEVHRRRWENVWRRHRALVASFDLPSPAVPPPPPPPKGIISDALRARLVEFFAGRCAGYYDL